MAKSKKRMPRFAEVMGDDANRIDAHTSPAKSAALAEMLAARMGGKVRTVKRGE